MNLSEALRLEVRQRANFACEFCGVTETDSGGELTIDHFFPRARGGGDDPDNLLYSCIRCNQYKADYWPDDPSAPALWNPRIEPMHTHLLALADGTFYPLTPTGAFTLRRLRLNRAPLVAYRLRHRYRLEEERLLTRCRDMIVLLERLYEQHGVLLEEQRTLLQEQRALMDLLLKSKGHSGENPLE
jgi:HNH endonuclease